jgi:ferrochelatase
MKGVLLVNLGSPDTPSPKNVKKYLDEFLMDERVIDVNIILRNILVRGIILNTRPKKSAEAYQKIWWDEGSPLIVLSERFHKKVDEKADIPVALGMRYGSMSIKEGYEKLQAQGVTEVLLVPLYPHYAMSSFETVEVKAREVQEKFFPHMKTDVFPAFYNKPDYIKVMAENIRKNLESFKYIFHCLFPDYY